MFFPHVDNPSLTMKTIINELLESVQKSGLITSPLGIENAQITAIATRPVVPELYDEPNNNNNPKF